MKKIFLIFNIACISVVLSYCSRKNNSEISTSPYLNQNDTVKYVGKETCRLCHSDQFETFIHTGMGLSFDVASREKSAASFDSHALVFDTINNYYYKPFLQNDTLKILEYRLSGKDTIHKRTESIEYIIGSGQHTNSHLIQVNGFLYQAPITFYTQKKKWDMAPGMEKGFNSRFSRIIEAECMTCHNGLPELIAGSVNKYKNIPNGIDCERCHGPGQIHIAQVSSGIVTDTSREIDYSIVNPKKLSIDLQNNLCLRCHLQGINVLNDGASYFDFKPGDKISDHWNIFLPKFDGKNDQFLMASQADRMIQSKCYVQTKNISCITCHNPHLTVKETTTKFFNAPCNSCHIANQVLCTEKISIRNLNEDNCSSCHMPKSKAVDIPHVSITDHKIQIPSNEAEKPFGKFLGLQCLTREDASPLLLAQAYLIYFEAFVHEKNLLDSASHYLNQTKEKNEQYDAVAIHLNYLKNNFSEVISIAQSQKNKAKNNGWTSYRIGESFLALLDSKTAEIYFQLAVDKMPYHLDFNLKLGSAKFLNGNINAAEKIFEFILTENPTYTKAHLNIAVISSGKGDYANSELHLIEAIKLDPDYLQARINLIDLYITTRQKQKAKDALAFFNKYYPNQPEAKVLSDKLKTI